jgi:predicted transcriptional regulator YdeE
MLALNINSSEWFPASAYHHIPGPELELYLGAGYGKDYCEIWIPIVKK